MDYIYVVELVALALVVIGLVVISYSLMEKRRRIFQVATQFSDDMKWRLAELDALMKVVSFKGGELHRVSLILQGCVERMSPIGFDETGVLAAPSSVVDSRKISVSGELKQSHLGVAGYLKSINVRTDQILEKTHCYLGDIQTFVNRVDHQVSIESEAVKVLHQEVRGYISAIQSNVSGDASEVVNPVDQKLIDTLHGTVSQLELLGRQQLEVQLVASALSSALVNAPEY